MSRIDFLGKTTEINLDHFLERSVGTKPALEDQSFRLTYRVHDNNIDVIIIGAKRAIPRKRQTSSSRNGEEGESIGGIARS